MSPESLPNYYPTSIYIFWLPFRMYHLISSNKFMDQKMTKVSFYCLTLVSHKDPATEVQLPDLSVEGEVSLRGSVVAKSAIDFHQ